ncbi:hypothetical protein CRUP_015621, partial [Coryphaenoides rupestris]
MSLPSSLSGERHTSQMTSSSYSMPSPSTGLHRPLHHQLVHRALPWGGTSHNMTQPISAASWLQQRKYFLGRVYRISLGFSAMILDTRDGRRTWRDLGRRRRRRDLHRLETYTIWRSTSPTDLHRLEIYTAWRFTRLETTLETYTISIQAYR